MNSDIRFQIVEERIRKAFFQLLTEKGFEPINVKMLVERAGINRTTFYNHYTDKYNLLTSVESELLQPIGEAFGRDDDDRIIIPPTIEQLNMITSMVYDRSEQLALICSEKVDPYLIDRTVRKISVLARESITADMTDTATEYMINAGCGAIGGLYKTWIGRGFQETQEEFVQQVFIVINKIKSVLEISFKM